MKVAFSETILPLNRLRRDRESGDSRGAFVDPFSGRVPIRKARIAFPDQTFPFLQDVLMPLRNRKGLRMATEVIPERFHGAQLVVECHLIQWQRNAHIGILTGKRLQSTAQQS